MRVYDILALTRSVWGNRHDLVQIIYDLSVICASSYCFNCSRLRFSQPLTVKGATPYGPKLPATCNLFFVLRRAAAGRREIHFYLTHSLVPS